VRSGTIERVEDRGARWARSLGERKPGRLALCRARSGVAWPAREHEAVDDKRILAGANSSENFTSPPPAAGVRFAGLDVTDGLEDQRVARRTVLAVRAGGQVADGQRLREGLRDGPAGGSRIWKTKYPTLNAGTGIEKPVELERIAASA